VAAVCVLILCAVGAWIALAARRSSATRTPESLNGAAQPVQQPQAPPARSRQELLRDFYTALDRTAASIDPAEIDVGARARRLADADSIFKWVAEVIRYEHYDGVLRGALGTMIAGAGNSCDKALLLSELLVATGHRAKVRVGVADGALNDRLVELALRTKATFSAAAADGPDDYLLSRASREVRSIASALPTFADALQQKTPVPAVASFCWVEDERAGSTILLDPTLQGQTAVAPDSDSDALARRRFTVRFSVVLETRAAGALKEELVHASSFSPDAIGYQPITLTITPTGDLSASLKKARDPWAELARVQVFYPVISIGDRREMTKGFSLDGKLVTATATPLQGVDSVADGIGGILSGGRPSPPSSRATGQSRSVSAAFERVRLDIEVTGPGVQERVSRSVVSGASLRAEARPGAAALRIIQQRQFLLPSFAVSRAYGAHLLVDYFRKNRAVLDAIASTSAPPDLPELHQYPLRLLALAARQDRGATLIGWRHSGTLFRNRPAVLAERWSFDTEHSVVGRRLTIDIMDTGFGALSRSGSSRLLRALLGAQSTLLETEVTAGLRGTGTIEVLQRAAARKINLVAIGSENDSAFDQVSIPASERAGLIQDLQEGYTVLTVPQLISATFPGYAWWRVDRNSGEVLGVLPTREGGQSATETFLKHALVGAIVGGTFTYLNCYFLQDQGGYRCLFAAACGAVVGGLSTGVGGLFGDASFGVILAGNAAGGAIGFPGEFCDTPPHNRNDNDGDGIPNDRDENDDNPRNDDSDLPDEPRFPGGPSDHDDDNDSYDDVDDDFPSDISRQRDSDRDGLADNEDPDIDNDNVPQGSGCRLCDAFPHESDSWADTDRDGVADEDDPLIDSDGDELQDEIDPCWFCTPNSNGAGDYDKDGNMDSVDPNMYDPKVWKPIFSRKGRFPDGPGLPDRAVRQ
jgi:hypothetical protein